MKRPRHSVSFDPMSPSRPASGLFNLLKPGCLVLLLIAGQLGAVVHELGHLSGTHGVELSTAPGDPVESTCGLCPSFAQVATPAFSHAWVMPLLVRARLERRNETPLVTATTAVPTPRSRGPPLTS
jgi:hypothetical protein